jgi:archaemetzincin
MFSLNKKQPFYILKSKLVLVLMLLFIGVSVSFQSTSIHKKEVTIYIQPLGNIDSDCLEYVKKSVVDFYGSKCVIKPKIELTNDLLAGSKTRYEANKMLAKYKSNSNLLLITEKDIAHRKSAQYPEWGIFGLGYRPVKLV